MKRLTLIIIIVFIGRVAYNQTFLSDTYKCSPEMTVYTINDTLILPSTLNDSIVYQELKGWLPSKIIIDDTENTCNYELNINTYPGFYENVGCFFQNDTIFLNDTIENIIKYIAIKSDTGVVFPYMNTSYNYTNSYGSTNRLSQFDINYYYNEHIDIVNEINSIEDSAFVMKIDFIYKSDLNNIRYVNTKTHQLRVFPNPAKTKITIRAAGVQDATIKLIDLSGRIIYNRLFDTELIINVDKLPPSIYLLKIENKDVELTKKVIIK